MTADSQIDATGRETAKNAAKTTTSTHKSPHSGSARFRT
jgi:hypothetical protein